MQKTPEQLDRRSKVKMGGRIARGRKGKRDDRAEGVKSIDRMLEGKKGKI